MRKRIVRIAAFMLAVVMVLTTSGLSVIAADLFTPSEDASDLAFDPAMVTAMAELCGSREAAEEVLESLYEKGFVDETGMPVESESFNVNGTVMTKEELRAEAETHVFDEQELVMIDGARITWSELKSLFAVMDMQDYIRSAEANGYHLTEKELASFAAALNEGRVKIITRDGKVYLSSGPSEHPQGTNVAPEGVARIYLTEVDTDTYTVDFTNTSSDVLARYNLNSFTGMTYQLKPAHVYEEPATGKLYIDTKMTTPVDVSEAARVTIQLTINALGGSGNYGGGAPVDGSDLTPLGGYRHILTSYKTTDFKVNFTIYAFRDTTVGESSVDLYIENGNLVKPVQISNGGTATADHVTITFKDGEDKVKLIGLNAFYNIDCWDPDQLHETNNLELISFFTFRNCQNCVVGIERRHGDSVHYSTVFNFGTYECVPYHVVLDGHDPRTYTEWVEEEKRVYQPVKVSDVTKLEPELIIPAGIYHPGDRIPVMIKFNTWIGYDTYIDETSGYELTKSRGFSGTVKLNAHGADNYRFGTDDVFTLTGPMNEDYVNYLYCTYLVKSEVDAATITASSLTIGDNVGETANSHGNIFVFHDSEDPAAVPYTPLTKFTFSNSDFKNAGQASVGNISSPDKTKIFDFAHASLVLAYDNDYYYRVPIVVPKDAGGSDQLEYLSWLCSDVGSDEMGRAYVKSLLSAGTVKNAKGENVSYLNRVYLEVDADTVFEYDDPLSGDHVKFTEKPLYIYLKAELDGSEDGSFGFTAAGVTDRDQNLFGSVELVGLRSIGGGTDITTVLATQQPDTLAGKLASGEWCRFLVTGAVYDGNPSVETYSGGFYTRDRARAYSKYLVLPCIEFSRIPQKQEDVLLVYSDTWKHYIDPDDTDLETKYNIPKLDPIKYDEYIGEGHTPLTLYYQLTGSASMSDCSDPEYFVWTSSDPTVATVTNRVDESLGVTVGDITLTGKNGTVSFTLTNTDSDLTWTTGSIRIIEADPYLYVPATSKPLITLENYPLDVVFCSNLPTYNAAMSKDGETTFTLNVYEAEWSSYVYDYVKSGDPLLSEPITATATPDHPVNVLTIPSGVLSEVSASGEVSYVAEITAVYRGPADMLGSDKHAYVSNGDGTYTFSASVPVKVKGAPLKIEMSEDNRHYFMSDVDSIEVEWDYYGSLGTHAEWIMTVTDEEGFSYVQQGTYKSPSSMKKYKRPESFIFTLDNNKWDGEIGNTNYGEYGYWSGFDNTKLKKTFIVTFAISTDPENLGYSVVSTKIVVYNKDAIDILVRDTHHSTSVDGDHVVFDNEGYIKGIAAADGTISIDLAELQNDVTLKSIVSINYGDYVWGLVSDQLKWKVTDADEKIDAANLYYSQSGVYSNVDRSLLPSYMPISSFMLIGEKEGTSTVTVTHAASGLESTVTVDVHKLENKLFLFQFYPLMKTALTYTDTKGVKKTVVSKENGQLALYDPDGIAPGSTLYFSATMGTGDDAIVFAGMKKAAYIESGERNSALGETYPVNVLELTRMEEADLFIKGANGKPLANQNVTIHGGVYVKTAASGNATVYENGKLVKIDGYEYKPKMDLLTPAQASSSSENVQGSDETSNGLEALTFRTDKNGMIRVVLNMDQLRPNFEIQTGEDIMFVFQIEVDGYKPVIVSQKLLGENGERSEAAVVTLQKADAPTLLDMSVEKPFITSINEYRIINYNRELISIGSEVTALGADTTYPEREVEFSTMLWGYESIIVPSDTDQQAAGADDFDRYSVCFSDILKGIEHNKTLGQGAADQHQSIWFYPFSTIPLSTTVLDCDVSSYSITPTKMWLDCKKSTAVDWAIFYDQNADPDVTELKVLRRTRFPYMIANNIDAKILAKDPRFAADIRAYAENMISEEEFGLSDIVPGGDILSACMAFISGLTSGGDHQVNMTVAATADPSVYKVLVIMGDEQGVLDWEDAEAGEEKDEGLYTKYGNMDPKDLDEALNNLMGEEKKEEEKEDDKVKFKFGGAMIGEARYDEEKDEWSFSVTGGSISLGVEFEVFKVDENFMVGPVPVTVSFEAKAGMMKSFTVDQVYVQRYIDLDGKIHDEPGYDATGYIPWEEYDVVKSYGFMIDSVLSAEVEAFAGVGFDYSVVALKLGISGKFKAEGFYAIGFTGIEERTVRFGAGVSLEGGIALQFKAQLLMLTYVKNIASVSFKAGIQSKGYTELVEMFHSATSKDDTYAGGYAEGSASFLDRTVEGNTNKALLRAPGSSIFGQHLDTENENFGRVSFSDDGQYIFYTDNLTASFAKANGTHIGALTDVNRDANSKLPDSKGDFGHFYMDGCGAGDDLFAAWVVQTQTTPRGEKGEEDTLTDLAIALNSTEIVAAVYDGSTWTTTQLTDNHAPDMSPTICSNGNKALVAWRSLYGSGSSDPLNFNVDNNIVYRYYDGTAWGETRTLYTGMMDTYNHTTENILSLDSCMLDDGSVLIVYTVQSESGDTDTYYTILHSWNYVSNGKYFKDAETYNLSSAPDRTDENAKVISVGNEAIIAWYTDEKADGTAGSDIRLYGLIVDKEMWSAAADAALPESVSSIDSSVTVTNNFVIAGNSRDGLTLGWSVPITEEGGDMSESRSAIYTSRVCRNSVTGSFTMSNPVLTGTAKGIVADDFCMSVDAADDRKVSLVLTETIYTGDPVKAGVILAEDIIRRTDYRTNAEYEEAVAEFERQYPEGLAVNRIPGYARLEKKDVTFIGELTVLGVSFDRTTVIPGLTIPVTYSVKNTGVTRIDTILIDGKEYTIGLDPNEQTQIKAICQVTGPAVEDHAFTIRSTDGSFEDVTGVLVFNIPRIDVGGVSVVSSGEGSRRVSVLLQNDSLVPMTDSGRVLEVSLFTDLGMETQIGETVIVTEHELVDLDAETVFFDISIADYVKACNEKAAKASGTKTANATKLPIGTTQEIPDEGLGIVAIVRVREDSEDGTGRILYENAGSAVLKSLITDPETPVYTEITEPVITPEDADNAPEGRGTVSGSGIIRSDSILDQGTKYYAVTLYNEDGEVIARQVVKAVLTPEHEVTFGYDFTLEDLGDYAEIRLEELKDGTLGKPEDGEQQFKGWYKDAAFTEEADADDTVAYAKYGAYPDVEINGANLILHGDICLVFHAVIREGGLGGKMVLSVNGADDILIDPADCEKDDKGRYLFPYYLSAIQMAEPVTATYTWGDGETVTKTFSVQDYVEAVVADDSFPAELKDLCRKLINYGHYAQLMTAPVRDWTIGEDYPEIMLCFAPTVSDDVFAADTFKVEKTGSSEQVTRVTLSLALDHKTEVYLYLTADTAPEVTVDGETAEVQLMEDGRYRAIVPGVPSYLLAEKHTVIVNGTLTYSLSALCYVPMVLNGSSFSEDDKNAVKALYEYYDASVAYLAYLNGTDD